MAPSSPTTPHRRSPSPSSSVSSDRTIMNSPTRYVPKRTLTSSASIQKHPKSTTGFQKFPKLPLEIQDLVWKEVLDLDAATVHGVEIRLSTTDQPTAGMVKTTLWDSDTGVERSPIYPTRHALRRVCRRSKAAVEREPRCWRAKEPYQLHSDRSWVPGEQVDLSRDLFVISTNLDDEPGPNDRIPGVRYVGVTWEGMWDLHIVQKLEKVVDLFPEVETIYVVVTAASTTHPNLETWSSEKSHVLETYSKECQETGPAETNAEFLSDGLVYKEIAVENLSEMAGLHEPLSFINEFYENWDLRCEEAEAEAETETEAEAEAEAEAEGETLRRPVIRVMTWEQAHRVSPRFP